MHGVLPKPEAILHHTRVHCVPAVPACWSPRWFVVRLGWEAAKGNAARHHCAVLTDLVSPLPLACEDGYKLENDTCVRYGDRSALLPHRPS